MSCAAPCRRLMLQSSVLLAQPTPFMPLLQVCDSALDLGTLCLLLVLQLGLGAFGALSALSEAALSVCQLLLCFLQLVLCQLYPSSAGCLGSSLCLGCSSLQVCCLPSSLTLARGHGGLLGQDSGTAAPAC